MIYLKSAEQIEQITKAGEIASKTLSLLSSFVYPGMTGLQLDKMAEEYIRDNGGIPSCKGYKGFEHSICFGVNHEAVHCTPTNSFLKEGDVVKIDLVVSYNGWNADTAITLIIPPAKNGDVSLVQDTHNALTMGILAAKEGKYVSDISKAIFEAKKGHGVVKQFCGHGIGRDIHENPAIPNYIVKEKDALLVSGMVICVEPIFTAGNPDIFIQPNSWPTWTLDKSNVAHFEHTLLINPSPQPPTVLTLRPLETII